MNEKDNKNIEISKMAQNMPIFKDTGFTYLYRKTEKISTAIYIITNFLSSSEPIKWQLRNVTMRLLHESLALSTTSMSSRPGLIRKISVDLFHVHSLFNIAFRSGFVSQMNYSLINTELEGLISFFDEYNNSQLSIESKLFDEKDFKVNVPKRQVVKREEYVKDYNSSPIKDIKDTYKGQKNNVLYKKRGDNKERRGKILEYLKDKDKVSVKDISKQITDCSEKTLQRELLSMVDDGLIVKEGERRWSRYSLKT
jgi:DNA-binding transcriptional ArsR family regulator